MVLSHRPRLVVLNRTTVGFWCGSFGSVRMQKSQKQTKQAHRVLLEEVIAF